MDMSLRCESIVREISVCVALLYCQNIMVIKAFFLATNLKYSWDLILDFWSNSDNNCFCRFALKTCVCFSSMMICARVTLDNSAVFGMTILVVLVGLSGTFWFIIQWPSSSLTAAFITFAACINDRRWRWTRTMGKLTLFKLPSYTGKLLVLTCCECWPLCLDNCVICLFHTFHGHAWVDCLIILCCYSLLGHKALIHLCTFNCFLVQLFLYDCVVSHTYKIQWVAFRVIDFILLLEECLTLCFSGSVSY